MNVNCRIFPWRKAFVKLDVCFCSATVFGARVKHYGSSSILDGIIYDQPFRILYCIIGFNAAFAQPFIIEYVWCYLFVLHFMLANLLQIYTYL